MAAGRTFCFALLAMVLLLPTSAVAQRRTSQGGINIPVHIGVLLGAASFKSSFADQFSGDPRSSFHFGGDFNVPLGKSPSSIGLIGWLGAGATSGSSTTENAMTVGLYYAYGRQNFDVFLGPGYSRATVDRKDADATPHASLDLSADMVCGIAGSRLFFGQILQFGLGVAAYTCTSSSFSKVTPTGTEKIDKSASNTGALIFLHASRSGERKLL